MRRHNALPLLMGFTKLRLAKAYISESHVLASPTIQPHNSSRTCVKIPGQVAHHESTSTLGSRELIALSRRVKPDSLPYLITYKDNNKQ
ncbi:hypothetical protein [Cyclobacterium amurskyense]|uniref:Uncharacterized protein n=1 Tax=Cyclobacterium amurskyense TaxID=320787 RepID=A0A0H4PIZ3_9BACT|nr:hypothetical protein [Cyclobacterium amurskyense]AKP52908.1 hypothetical protein CA2015_3528 [Cyclobacterium amurskyense]